MKDKLKIISLCDGMSCGALALEHWLDQEGITVENTDGGKSSCSVVDLPFYDKEKAIPRGKDTSIPERV